jgi:hypothetical protein
MPIDIEQFLVWVFRDQCAHVIEGRGVGLFAAEAAAGGIRRQATSADGCANVERLALLGCSIDGGGMANGLDLHPDAERAYAVVNRLSEYGHLLVRYARIAERPEWGDTLPPKCEPAWKEVGPRYDASGMPARGSYRTIYGNNRHALWCPIIWINDPRFVGAVRAEYARWFAALEVTAEYFAAHPGELAAHTITGPSAPARPWERPARLGAGVVTPAVTPARSFVDTAKFA